MTKDEATETPDSFESPESSNIQGAHYDEGTMTLTITFKAHKEGENRVYQASCFTKMQWEEFAMAKSKGTFFAQNIKPLFNLVRL